MPGCGEIQVQSIRISAFPLSGPVPGRRDNASEGFAETPSGTTSLQVSTGAPSATSRAVSSSADDAVRISCEMARNFGSAGPTNGRSGRVWPTASGNSARMPKDSRTEGITRTWSMYSVAELGVRPANDPPGPRKQRCGRQTGRPAPVPGRLSGRHRAQTGGPVRRRSLMLHRVSRTSSRRKPQAMSAAVALLAPIGS